MTLSMSHDALSHSYAVQFQAVAGSSNSPLRSGEIIHSGQFMVSDFEAEAQDEDDNEIKMPDPDDPNLERDPGPTGGALEACTAVQRYAPRTGGVLTGAAVLVSSRVEIDTTLAKLFKCMNLAYSQKLTSPKWNHFKGVRLRWKDKIRLNNVIWRCWHMQFFLKKRTPVCQFASPLDVDIHSNPQTVVLEGKYWKRQLVVIKAEYRKWRRNFKSNAIGTLTCDSKSEFDFSELQLPSDRLMLTDDWSDDSLFSAINGPFPFPDPREIARDAGRADFIQPSLGPLQPNIDDIDLSTFHELLDFRLPPVPEEGAEDMLKSVDFFPMMGSERMDSANIEEITNNAQSHTMSGHTLQDTSMLDMNPLGSIRYTGTMEIDNNPTPMITSHGSDSNRMIASCDYRNQIADTNVSKIQNSFGVVNSFPIATNASKQTDNLSSIHTSLSQCGGHNNNNNRNILIGRITKSRKINYDKAQPTTHQTLLYQQMLAEQQDQQQQRQQQQQQSAQQHSNHQQMVNSMQYSHQFSNASVLSAPGNFSSQSSNVLSSPEMKSYSFPQQSANFQIMQQNMNNSPSDILSMLSSGQDNFKSNVMQQNSPNSTYRVYNNATNFKKGASSAGYINLGVQSDMRQHSPTGNSQINQYISNQQQSQQLLQQQMPHIPQQITDKEMYRSNSLPLNASLPQQPKGDNFVVPKYQVKTSRSRTRSNSMQQSSGQGPPPLQPALSEPMLNKSTLAQLLTSNSNTKLIAKQSTSTSAITSLPPSGFSPTYSSSSNIQPIVQTQQLTQSSVIKQQQQRISPTRSTPLSQAPIQSSSSTDNKVFNFSASSLTPAASFSPESYADPGSPLSPSRSTSNASQLRFPRDNQRRAGHIHAEQKRRGNIKDRFDMLHSLIPQLQQNPNPKLSKAATLQKAAEYIKELNGERYVIKEKIEALRKERDALNASLLHLQSILPANGAPVSRQKTEQVKQLYNQYVRYKTNHTWKFWILGLILEPLISSYTTTVSVASIEELYRTALLWVDQHCSLVELRPAVSNKLRYLSTTTDILSDPPSSLEEEVTKAINNTSGEHPNLTSS